MIKQIQTSNAETHPNSKEIRVLKEYFPSCFSKDGSFDFLHFKSLLKDKVDIQNEGYELNFLGKSYAKLLVSLDTETIIVPDIEHNSKQENVKSENIYISGDNLDGLKHLLKSYSGQVKCIYIDPPYNTGKDDFAYNDNFRFTAEELVSRLSIGEDEATRVLEMTQIGSSSHSAWLMFMYPRLVLARDLLTKDGVIFISIDDNEQANLKLLCDTVFGEENMISQFPRITKRGGKSSDVIALNNDYVLAYSKTSNPLLFSNLHTDPGFKFQDEYYEERGLYKLNQTLDYDSLQYSKSLDYPIAIEGETLYPGGDKEAYDIRQSGIHDRADWAWRWGKKKYNFGIENGFVVLKRSKNGCRIYTKTYQKASIEENENGYYIDYDDRTKALSTLEFTSNIYSNDNATKDINRSIGKNMFDYSKPISLIDMILSISTDQNDIVLDFFSGSATTAEAVMWHNLYNTTKNLRYILVQLPELVKENTSASKLYTTIDDIGRQRIVMSACEVRENSPKDTDLGFKHYTLRDISDTALNRITEFNPDEKLIFQNIYEEFGIETILSTWMVNDGYGFTAQPLELDLDGYKAWYYKKHLYLIEPGLTEESTCRLFEKYSEEGHFTPENIVMFGYSFSMTEFNMIKLNMKSLRDGNLKTNLDIRY